MRIANIPPQMWMTTAMQAAAPEVVYVGPAPQTDPQSRALATLFAKVHHPSHAAFVYILLHVDATVIYAGKARNPVARLAKHRRREWWDEVYNLVLLRVEGETEREADATALYVEALAIKHLAPYWNIAGVDARAMNKRGVYA